MDSSQYPDPLVGHRPALVAIPPPLHAAHRAPATSAWLRLWIWSEAAVRDFLNLVMPTDCVMCGCEDQTLCPACTLLLRRQTSSPFRAEHSAEALVGVSGESHVSVTAGGEYRDTLAAAILAFKNHGRTELSAALCRALARTLAAALAELPRPSPSGQDPWWLVPIPSTGNGWRRRGYDPVAMILRKLVREGRLPEGVAIVPILAVRTRLPWQQGHQKGLGRAGRRRNVRNALRIRQCGGRNIRLIAEPSGQRVILVDDVLTTGSTLREAAKTLEKSGFITCGAVVLAATGTPNPRHEMEAETGGAENSLGQKMNKLMQ